MRKKTRKQLFWGAIILFFLATPPILLYANGWRITPDFSLKRVGGLFVSAGTTGAEIYLDGKLQKRTNILQQGTFVQGLTPGTVSVLIAKEGYWPWTKDLSIEESFVAEARAFLVPYDITGTAILEGKYSNVWIVPGKEVLLLEKKTANGFSYDFFIPRERRVLTITRGYNNLLSLIPLKTFVIEGDELYILFPSKTVHIAFHLSEATATADIVRALSPDPNLPSFPHMIIIDSHEQSRLWLSKENTSINGKWLSGAPLPYYFSSHEIEIFSSPERIKSFDFYPGRRDVILFAIQNNIFAIELDSRSTRNFQPVYKGRNPYFARIGNTLYIIDGNSLLETRL